METYYFHKKEQYKNKVFRWKRKILKISSIKAITSSVGNRKKLIADTIFISIANSSPAFPILRFVEIFQNGN